MSHICGILYVPTQMNHDLSNNTKASETESAAPGPPHGQTPEQAGTTTPASKVPGRPFAKGDPRINPYKGKENHFVKGISLKSLDARVSELELKVIEGVPVVPITPELAGQLKAIIDRLHKLESQNNAIRTMNQRLFQAVRALAVVITGPGIDPEYGTDVRDLIPRRNLNGL